MGLNSKWNRRAFWDGVGVAASSILAPRKLFSSNRRAATPAGIAADRVRTNAEIPTKNSASPR